MTKVYIHPIAMHKINTWIAASPIEVSGMGKVLTTENGLYITDVWLPKQTNGPAETEFDADSLADLHYDTKDIAGTLTYYWHSHVNMECEWSGTDIDTIQTMAGRGVILASVFNKKGEQRTVYAHAGAIDKHIAPMWQDDLDLNIGTPDDDDLIKVWQANCTEKTYAPINPLNWSTRCDLPVIGVRSFNGQREVSTTKGDTLLTNSAGTQEGFKETTATGTFTPSQIKSKASKIIGEFNQEYRKWYSMKKGFPLKEVEEMVEAYTLQYGYLPEDGYELLDYFDIMMRMNPTSYTKGGKSVAK